MQTDSTGGGGAVHAERPGVLQVHAEDNVATAVRDIAPGECVMIGGGERQTAVTAVTTIPRGHKIALAAIPCGGGVIKYGNPIGHATADIAIGEHVHVHNMVGDRGRADRLRQAAAVAAESERR